MIWFIQRLLEIILNRGLCVYCWRWAVKDYNKKLFCTSECESEYQKLKIVLPNQNLKELEIMEARLLFRIKYHKK